MRDRLEDTTDTPRTAEQEHAAVDRFAGDMMIKLRKNGHKRHWKEVSCAYLLKRLKEEVKELEDALMGGYVYSEVISECADVANMAMMIADNQRGNV